MTPYVVALGCVVGIAIGQILFKASAGRMNAAGTMLDPSGLAILAVSLALYGITTIAWVWVLRQVELGRVYPLMALAFVLVPLASRAVFGEELDGRYALGVGLIVVGLVVALRPA